MATIPSTTSDSPLASSISMSARSPSSARAPAASDYARTLAPHARLLPAHTRTRTHARLTARPHPPPPRSGCGSGTLVGSNTYGVPWPTSARDAVSSSSSSNLHRHQNASICALSPLWTSADLPRPSRQSGAHQGIPSPAAMLHHVPPGRWVDHPLESIRLSRYHPASTCMVCHQTYFRPFSANLPRMS